MSLSSPNSRLHFLLELLELSSHLFVCLFFELLLLFVAKKSGSELQSGAACLSSFQFSLFFGSLATIPVKRLVSINLFTYSTTCWLVLCQN